LVSSTSENGHSESITALTFSVTPVSTAIHGSRPLHNQCQLLGIRPIFLGINFLTTKSTFGSVSSPVQYLD
jgi:hypothetical protein